MTNIFSTVKPFTMSDPTTKRLARYLESDLKGAEDYLARLIDTKDIASRAFYDCGNHRLDTAEKLRTIARETSKIGFQLFAIRLKALGLAEGYVRRLYGGSADYQNTAAI